ncbi:MAG: NUDIX domain-containing protein [Patescibacteria group bacterium]
MKKRVRAIIKKGNAILLIHRIKKGKEYWVFPGGGIEESDTNKETALIRECKEELGVNVQVGKLFAASDFISDNEKKCEYFYKLIKGLNIVDVIILRPTSNHKSFKKCEKIIKRLIKVRASRNSCLISIGGGYVSDITCYTASVYMRGIDFIQIPTTLMSMVDAVIGKVAINFEENKNLIGSFYSPKYVFSDLNFLSTVSKKEKILGLSEVWKHGLIKRDNNIIRKIENCLSNFSDEYYSEFIHFSMKVKKDCVVSDYNDRKGKHKALSLGHTFANFLEKKNKYETWSCCNIRYYFCCYFI